MRWMTLILFAILWWGIYSWRVDKTFLKAKPVSLFIPGQVQEALEGISGPKLPKIIHGKERILEISGPEWDEFYSKLKKSIETKEPSKGWEHRRNDAVFDTQYFESLFFLPQEHPLRDLGPISPGETIFVKINSGKFLEVYALMPGQEKGMESGHTDMQLSWNRPDAMVHPFRSFGPLVILGGLFTFFLGPVLRLFGLIHHKSGNSFVNPQRNVARGWGLVSLVISGLMMIPWAAEIDMMRWGYGLVFLLGFFLLFSLIIAFVYAGRANRLDKLFDARNLIVHWTYSEEEWRRFMEKDVESLKERNQALFGMLLVITIIIGGIFIGVHPNQGGVITALVLAGLVLLIGVMVRIMPGRKMKKQMQAAREVRLSPFGVYVGREFHVWDMLLARLEEVTLSDELPVMIDLTYSYPTRTGRDSWTVHVPVPEGREGDVSGVLESLKKMIVKQE